MQKNNSPFSLLIILLLIIQGISSFAQDSSFNSYTSINKITVGRLISDRVTSSFVNPSVVLEKDINSINFTPGIKYKGVVPNNIVTKKLLLKFNIRNATDTINSIYFFPGFYYTNIQLFRLKGASLVKIPNILPANSDSIGYRLITLNPFDSATIIAELSFLKTYINSIRPRLVNINHLNSFIAEIRTDHDQDNLFTYLFCGLLLMMS